MAAQNIVKQYSKKEGTTTAMTREKKSISLSGTPDDTNSSSTGRKKLRGPKKKRLQRRK